MSYSFTEKKRIRKDFARSEVVVDVPFLLKTQVESYDKFLGKMGSDKHGLHDALNVISERLVHNPYWDQLLVFLRMNNSLRNWEPCSAAPTRPSRHGQTDAPEPNRPHRHGRNGTA